MKFLETVDLLHLLGIYFLIESFYKPKCDFLRIKFLNFENEIAFKITLKKPVYI